MWSQWNTKCVWIKYNQVCQTWTWDRCGAIEWRALIMTTLIQYLMEISSKLSFHRHSRQLLWEQSPLQHWVARIQRRRGEELITSNLWSAAWKKKKRKKTHLKRGEKSIKVGKKPPSFSSSAAVEWVGKMLLFRSACLEPLEVLIWLLNLVTSLNFHELLCWLSTLHSFLFIISDLWLVAF